MDLLNSLFGNDAEPIAVQETLSPDRLMSELNIGGDVLLKFELRKQIHQSRDHSTHGEGSILDTDMALKCRDIRDSTRIGHALLQEQMTEYQLCMRKLAEIENARVHLHNQFGSVDTAIHNFLKACLKYDHSSTLVDSVGTALQELASVRDGIVKCIQTEVPTLQQTQNRAAQILRLLSSTYQGLRITTAMYTCPICIDRQVDRFLMPCGHTVCNECLCELHENCPCCRKHISGSGDLYFT